MSKTITAAMIRELYHRDPFQPFTLTAEDGRQVTVPRRDRLVISPSGRFILVVTPDESILQVNLRRMVDLKVKPARRLPKIEPRRRKAG